MILASQHIRAMQLLDPLCERTQFNGVSFGLSAAGYDIRTAENLDLLEGGFKLCSSVEKFHMRSDVLGIVHDKSTWARRGIAVQNTVIEPGWHGYLTLEITNHGKDHVFIKQGSGIAQIIFHMLLEATEQVYDGKYQNQEAGPQFAR